jgi:hypothetical protein
MKICTDRKNAKYLTATAILVPSTI